MRKALHFLLACLAWAALALPALAQPDRPEIDARRVGGEWGEAALTLDSLDLDLSQAAGVLQATWTVVIGNPGESDIEARLRLPLPDGAVINGYALDIDGALVDGVLSEKERAETVYTERVAARIDPGIAGRTDDSRYETKLYPVLPGQTRTVRLSYAAPWPAGALDVPVGFGQTIREMTVTLDGVTVRGWPAGLSSGAPNRDVRPEGVLSLERPAITPTLSRHSSGDLFLSLPVAASEGVRSGGHVSVLWDASASRRDDDRAAELALLERMLGALSPVRVSVVAANHRVLLRETDVDVSTLSGKLESIIPDGASDLGALLAAAPDSDVCLLVSDGRNTMSARLALPDCAVIALRRDAGGDLSTLGWLASSTGGAVIGAELAEREAEAVALRRTERPGAMDGLDAHAATVAGLTLWTARLDSRGDLPPALSGLQTVDADGPGALWADGAVLAERARGPERRAELLRLARRYIVQGPETAFLVLEEAVDYLRADIDPPQSYLALRGDRYRTARADYLENEKSRRAGALTGLRAQWAAYRTWYDTDWALQAKIRASEAPTQDAATGQYTVGQTQTQTQTGEPAPASPPPPAPVLSDDALMNESADAIIVTGSRVSRESRGRGDAEPIAELDRPVDAALDSTPSATSSLKPWQSDRPYVRRLRKTPTVETYRKLRREHGDAAAFYFDVSDALRDAGLAAAATDALLSALDLPGASDALRRGVAARLMVLGQTDHAVTLYRSLLPRADHRPQPRLDLARALVARGRTEDQREALGLLDDVAIGVWDSQYDGAALIGLVEANALRARLGDSLPSEVPADLQDNLPLDVRVVLDWTYDAVDIDLWVTEPTGENASYQNKETAIGGRVSNDMTRGFGPESYSLRRGVAGEYGVSIKLFSNSRYADVAPDARATLITDFGRPTETRRSIVVDFGDGDEKERVAIGSLSVADAAEDGVAPRAPTD